MVGAKQAGFLVHVADGTQEPTHNLEVCMLPDIILGHLEHAEVQIGDWAEGSTCDKDDWGFLGILEDPLKTVMGKGVVGWAGE